MSNYLALGIYFLTKSLNALIFIWFMILIGGIYGSYTRHKGK